LEQQVNGEYLTSLRVGCASFLIHFPPFAASPQIKFLVSGLEKKNQSASVAELNDLVNLYGQDGRIFLITCLVDQIDFRDSKAPQKSAAKVNLRLRLRMGRASCINADSADRRFLYPVSIQLALLTREVGEAYKQANFVSLICQALEGTSGRSPGGRTLSSRLTDVRLRTFIEIRVFFLFFFLARISLTPNTNIARRRVFLRISARP
jgi:hypothetical protein